MQQRVIVVPSFTRFGVTVIGLLYRALIAVPGGRRAAAVVASRPVPVLGEYPRLIRSLGYAYVWEHWPDTRPSGAPRDDRGIGHDTMDAEVVVIGSGAGGATTAAVLAEAGFDVLIVEEGEWVEQGAVVPFSLEQMERQYRSGGVTVALGLPSIAYTEGRCAGGGTEINSGLYRRPPEDVLQRWANDFRIADLDDDEVLAIADEVEQTLNVTTVPGPPSAPSDVLRRGAERLGWQHSEIPRWMTYRDGDPDSWGASEHDPHLSATSGRCRGAAGHRLSRRPARASRRAAPLGPPPRTLTAAEAASASGTSFVCGGAIQTPALLQRSHIAGRIGRSLAVHPTVKLAARFADELNVPDDVPVHQVKEFAPDLSFGGSASQPGLVALALSDQWRTFARAIHRLAAHQRLLRGDHQRGPWQGEGRARVA